MCDSLRNCRTVFPQWPQHFTFPAAAEEDSNFSASLPTPVMCVCVFSSNEVCITLWLSILPWACWLLIHLLRRKVYSSPLLTYLGCCSFIIELYEFLYILDIRHLSDIWFANISSHLVACLFTFLMVPFKVQKFLLFKKIFYLSIFREGERREKERERNIDVWEKHRLVASCTPLACLLYTSPSPRDLH